MNLYTIGFTRKTAKQFFELLQNNHIDILVDIRLNNNSQLAGFTKSADLKYFLDAICGCAYEHCIEYAPNKELFDGYRNKALSWDEFVKQFTKLLKERRDYINFPEQFKNYQNVCLLCSEPTPDHCHRGIVAGLVAENSPQITVRHLQGT